MNEKQLVIVQFQMNNKSINFLTDHEFKRILRRKSEPFGEYDGHSTTGNSTIELYFYGPDAKTLFNAVKPSLTEKNYLVDAQVTLRWGTESTEFPLFTN